MASLHLNTEASLHQWTEGWGQVGNILCRKRRTAKGEEEQVTKSCLYDGALCCCCCLRWALFHLKAAQSISAITTVCLLSYLTFYFLEAHTHTPLSLWFSPSLWKLKSMFMLQAGVWCMMRIQGTWVAWRPHMSSLMPWCFGHSRKMLGTQAQN